MPTQEETKNLEVISKYFAEYWGKANADIVDELCSEDFVINYPMHGPRYGKVEAKKMLNEFKAVSTTSDGFIYLLMIPKGFSRHLFPRVPTPTHCQRALRGRTLDRRRNSHWRCFPRSCSWELADICHWKKNVFLWHDHIHSQRWKDR